MPTLQSISISDQPAISTVQLPDHVFLDMPSRDLLLRLLEVQPHKRLRSYRALGTIAFYKDYKFENISDKQVKAKELLVKYFGEDYAKSKEEDVSFEGFDEIFITE